MRPDRDAVDHIHSASACQRSADVFLGDSEVAEQAGGEAVLDRDQAEQDVLVAERLVAGLGQSALEDLFQARLDAHAAGARVLERPFAERLLDPVAHRVQVDPERRERLRVDPGRRRTARPAPDLLEVVLGVRSGREQATAISDDIT